MWRRFHLSPKLARTHANRTLRSEPLEVRLALAVLFVDRDAAGLNTGTSWPDAYDDLQLALAAAQSGDEIWIAEGAYFPTSGTDRTATFRMVDGVNLYGGFAGDETAADQADPIGLTTLLNGNIGSTGSTQDNSLHVVTIDPGVRLRWDGISVFGGNANASGVDHQRGGGLLNAGSLVMNRSGFWSNHAQQHGGAIYNSGEIVITRSDLVGNMAGTSQGEGGAIYNAGRLTIADSTIQSNGAGRGGGILHDGDDLSIRNSSLIANYAGQGGSIYQRSGAVAFSHNTLAYNYTYGTASGGGIFATTHEVHLTHTLVAGNTQYSYTTPVQTESFPDDVSGPFSPASSFNLVGVGDGSTGLADGANGNRVGSLVQPIDARLSSSAVGGTVYLSPLLDSPALDAGDPSFDPNALTPPLTADQGGLTRVFDGDGDGSARIDIGSVETHSLRLAVTIADDEVDDDYSPDDLSLREAILLGNAAGQPTTIDVPAGHYLLTHGEARPCSPYDDHPGQLIVSGRPMTVIRGAGQGETIIDAGGRHRVFGLEGNVALEDMTIQGGSTQRCGGYGAGIYRNEDNGPLTLRRVELRDNIARGNGGGLWADEDNDIQIIDSEIWGNRAEGFSDYDPGQGGGIFIRESALELVGTRVRDNFANADGGGIALNSGTSSLVRSTVEANHSDGNGGGLWATWSMVEVIDSDISRNSAVSNGGGIYVQTTEQLTIQRSRIADNVSRHSGGGLFAVHADVTINASSIEGNGAGIDHELGETYSGGGVFVTGTTIFDMRQSTVSGNRVDGQAGGLMIVDDTHFSIVNSTISGNTATEAGAILVTEDAGGVIAHSTIVDNRAQRWAGIVYNEDVVLNHSILARNRTEDVPGGRDLDLQGWNNYGATFNLIGAVEDLWGFQNGVNGNIVGSPEAPVDPRLGPLEYNGSPTRTHAPLPGSPVIEAGDPAFDPASFTPPLVADQRDQRRVADGNGDLISRIDIGAVEFSPFFMFADITEDGRVDLLDLVLLQSNLGDTTAEYLQGDLDADGRIDPTDAAILLENFGRVMPMPPPPAAPQAALAAQSSATRHARLQTTTTRRNLVPPAVDHVLTTAPTVTSTSTRLRASRSPAAAARSPQEAWPT